MAATQEPGQRDLYAEARLLLAGAQSAVLATARDNAPYAALVTPAFMADYTPVLLLSTLSAHTRQLQANPACALLIAGTPADENPQTAPRLCLSGNAALAADAKMRDIYLARHPYANLYADFGDFAFWQINLTAAHFVGGFAAASRLEIARL